MRALGHPNKRYVLGDQIRLLNGQIMRVDGIVNQNGITYYQLVSIDQESVPLPKQIDEANHDKKTA